MAANGTYGTSIPAYIGEADVDKYVDIVYAYSSTRNSLDSKGLRFSRLDSSVLKNARSLIDDRDDVVEGLYDLNLPSNIFGRKGFYTIYIRPKEVPATIADVSTLKDFPSVRGVVLDLTQLDSDVAQDATLNNGLVGYRIVYLAQDGSRTGDIRTVTSNNKCQPISEVSVGTSSKSYSYRYNESSTLTFLTVTPSMPMSTKESSIPFIGTAGQQIYLVNTLFEPVCIELEMVDNDADTLATMVSGSQLRDLNNGIITTFDDDNNIFMQHEVSTLKRTETGVPQYEIKEKRSDNIDFSQTISDKI